MENILGAAVSKSKENDGYEHKQNTLFTVIKCGYFLADLVTKAIIGHKDMYLYLVSIN